MAAKTWPVRRKQAAAHVASILYGVVMILTAALVLEPEDVSLERGVGGAIGVGLAIFLTCCFTEVVKTETSYGRHVSFRETVRIASTQMSVMVFPLATAAIVAAGLSLGVDPERIVEIVSYTGVVTVFVVGFSSTYLLEGRFGFALRRGLYWLVLSAFLVVIN